MVPRYIKNPRLSRHKQIFLLHWLQRKRFSFARKGRSLTAPLGAAVWKKSAGWLQPRGVGVPSGFTLHDNTAPAKVFPHQGGGVHGAPVEGDQGRAGQPGRVVSKEGGGGEVRTLGFR